MIVCHVCGKGYIIHNALYTFTCNVCGHSYKVDPAGKTPTITILKRGKYYEGKNRNENR